MRAIFLFVVLTFLLVSCKSSNVDRSTEINSDLMSQVLDSKTYDIPITSMVNRDGTQSKVITNMSMKDNLAIRNDNNRNNNLDADSYYIRVRPNIIAISLPYSGKSRSASLSYNASETITKNISMNNVDYEIEKSNNGDKIISFNVLESNDDIKKIVVTIDKNGTAYIKANKIAGNVVDYVGYIYN